MQDNVTQADREVFKIVASLSDLADAGLAAGLWDNDRRMQALAAHRIASTAQPEVKGLVEALEREAKKAAEMAAYAVKHDFDAMGEALDNMRHRLEAALAAYHEAQP